MRWSVRRRTLATEATDGTRSVNIPTVNTRLQTVSGPMALRSYPIKKISSQLNRPAFNFLE